MIAKWRFKYNQQPFKGFVASSFLYFRKKHIENIRKRKRLRIKKNLGSWLGMVAHTCNPSSLGGQGEWITWGQEFETSLANVEKHRLKKKDKKLDMCLRSQLFVRLRQENRLNPGGRGRSEPRWCQVLEGEREKWAQRIFRAVKLLCMITPPLSCHYTFVQSHGMYNAKSEP